MLNRTSTDQQENQQTEVLERTEPDVELLVAYLDGELNGDDVRLVEDRLSQEPQLRQKMTSLEQTWNMLDALETVPVDKTLVQSTMEVVALTIENELHEGEAKQIKRKTVDRIVNIAIFAMVGLIGFQLASLFGVRLNEQILEDIPVIEQINQYKEIDSIDFLRQLADKKIFDTSASSQVDQASGQAAQTPNQTNHVTEAASIHDVNETKGANE